jgi:hypothetical protein
MSGRGKKGAGDDLSRHIGAAVTLTLWVRSGGRCAMCNKVLLEEPYFERQINLGERAHSAGWTDAPGSPRGDSEVPLSKRNEADNLILLCLECHKIIDAAETRADYPESLLLEIKREHEERIHHLTAMARDRETAVLRVFGAVRGSLPELARDRAMRAVIDGAGRYAKFPFAVDRYSVEVNLSTLADPETTGDDTYWRLGRSEIDRAMARVADHVHEKQVRHLSIFALARIPLLVYLGFALDDKVPIDLYQKQRGGDEGWLWPEDGLPEAFEIIQHRDGAGQGGVVLVLSLSGTVPLSDLPKDLANLPAFEIRPVGTTPNPNLFRSRATLDAFARTYQALLSRLEVTHKQATHIHLFPAVPITAAIACGRSLMRQVHPALVVYERIGNEFRPAIAINER